MPKYTRWKDLTSKLSPEEHARIKREALAELDRVGYAALRKAREMTQMEMAEKLGISQPSVAGIEARTDLQLSTLAKYIRAMGGELEMRAVFPEATFNLAPPATAEPNTLAPAAPPPKRPRAVKASTAQPRKRAAMAH